MDSVPCDEADTPLVDDPERSKIHENLGHPTPQHERAHVTDKQCTRSHSISMVSARNSIGHMLSHLSFLFWSALRNLCTPEMIVHLLSSPSLGARKTLTLPR